MLSTLGKRHDPDTRKVILSCHMDQIPLDDIKPHFSDNLEIKSESELARKIPDRRKGNLAQLNDVMDDTEIRTVICGESTLSVRVWI